jgi:hypothetical protein
MTPCIEFVRVWLLVLSGSGGFFGFYMCIDFLSLFNFWGACFTMFLSCSHIVPNVFPKGVPNSTTLLASHGLPKVLPFSLVYI